MGSPVTRFQIVSAQPDATAAFCAQVFGWQINADNPMGYREISTGSGEGIQGGIWPAPQHAPTFVQLFIQADDVDVASTRAQEFGARMIVAPVSLPDGERMAVLHDPTGLAFAICSRPKSASHVADGDAS